MGRLGMSAKFIPTASGPAACGGQGGGGGGGGGGSLYPFSSHEFTTCGQSNDYGPQLSNCRSTYGTDWVNDTEYFDMDVRGIQRWKIPQSGSYSFDARSGSGRAYSSNARRGYGGRIQGTFELQQGLWLEIAISQGGWGAGGSAGGTFIILEDNGTRTPLLIVGGGGGQDGRYSHTNGDWDGGTNGKNASDGYSGGSNGNGGQGPGGNGTAGCGYLSNSNDTRGHYSFLQGGSQPSNNSLRGDYNGGGFGGGGGSTDDQGSGGGGYSGGAGTAENSTGGGGGSYFNTSKGTNRQNLGTTSSTHGECKITKG